MRQPRHRREPAARARARGPAPLGDALPPAPRRRCWRELGIPLPDTTRARSARSRAGSASCSPSRGRCASSPDLLILDEPTASLGVNESAQVEELTATRRASAARRCCSSRTTSTRCSGSPTASSCCATAASSPRSRRPSTHPDDVVALISGQQTDSSARRQLSRLHGLADRLASADPSSSLLADPLGARRARSDRARLRSTSSTGRCCASPASSGLPPALIERVGRAAVRRRGRPGRPRRRRRAAPSSTTTSAASAAWSALARRRR